MQDILKINRAKWRTGQGGDYATGKGGTMLLNDNGFMCCLGFRCNQLGIPKTHLLGEGEPEDVFEKGWEVIPDLVGDKGGNTEFSTIAMRLNDELGMTTKEREKEITKHFATKKIKVVFYGKYK